MHNEIKVGDWYVQNGEYSNYNLSKPAPRQVIKVTPTDVYLESRFYIHGARFEHKVFNTRFRKLSKLEQYLEGYDSP
jgi:hypothetical protein